MPQISHGISDGAWCLLTARQGDGYVYGTMVGWYLLTVTVTRKHPI